MADIELLQYNLDIHYCPIYSPMNTNYSEFVEYQRTIGQVEPEPEPEPNEPENPSGGGKVSDNEAPI